jgi:hypothetical protein
LLPLAWSVSLLLLLSSLSLQALALQEGGLQAVLQRRRLQEDQLMAAAQQLAGRLQRRHPCLLPIAHQHWLSSPCAHDAALEDLDQGVALGQPWRLVHYRPEAPTEDGEASAEVVLQQQSGGAAAAFALHWRLAEGDGSPQLLALRELGLRQVQP